MKRLILTMWAALLGVVLLASCNSSLEDRVAELENRVAELEDKSSVANPTALKVNQPENTSNTANAGTPKFDFTEESHDFGSISEGDVVEHTFKFKNTGSAPLIIQSATASCGCTVPSYPKEPVAPGTEGEILVKFDSQNKPGVQNKTVTITANTEPPTTKLFIKSNVLSKDSQAAGPVRK